MIKLYYASAIDVCLDKALHQIEAFKRILGKYYIDVYGAGFKDSPVIKPDSSESLKGVVTANDLRVIRECDIFLLVTDLETFCPGSCMELEYARQMGLYTIVLCTSGYKTNNIFLETFANKIIYSVKELEDILGEIENA